ncbi:hypothetical protein [Thermococcus sp. GR6]|uniref:hypothetical protein n=1 Tax=Thermococcus sp. GR6 TaxID=1638256 RepID=UPI0014319C36|nr:hypothetical protein [Thermococcus sp. GR6]
MVRGKLFSWGILVVLVMLPLIRIVLIDYPNVFVAPSVSGNNLTVVLGAHNPYPFNRAVKLTLFVEGKDENDKIVLFNETLSLSGGEVFFRNFSTRLDDGMYSIVLLRNGEELYSRNFGVDRFVEIVALSCTDGVCSVTLRNSDEFPITGYVHCISINDITLFDRNSGQLKPFPERFTIKPNSSVTVMFSLPKTEEIVDISGDLERWFLHSYYVPVYIWFVLNSRHGSTLSISSSVVEIDLQDVPGFPYYIWLLVILGVWGITGFATYKRWNQLIALELFAYSFVWTFLYIETDGFYAMPASLVLASIHVILIPISLLIVVVYMLFPIDDYFAGRR